MSGYKNNISNLLQCLAQDNAWGLIKDFYFELEIKEENINTSIRDMIFNHYFDEIKNKGSLEIRDIGIVCDLDRNRAQALGRRIKEQDPEKFFTDVIKMEDLPGDIKYIYENFVGLTGKELIAQLNLPG